MTTRDEIRPNPDSGKRGIQPAYPLGPMPPRPTPLTPPAPAAITEDVTIRLPREQADAIRKTLRAELLSWGFGRTGSPMWTKMNTFVAALDEALDSAAPAQSGGERNKE